MSEPRTEFRCVVCGKPRREIDLRLDAAGAYRCKDTCWVEREAASPAALDVLTLTEAFLSVFPGWIEEADGNRSEIEENAAAVAAEYARLAQQDGTPTPAVEGWAEEAVEYLVTGSERR